MKQTKEKEITKISFGDSDDYISRCISFIHYQCPWEKWI